MTTGIAEYNQTEAALADLSSRYGGVIFEVSTTKGIDEAKKARAEVRGYRTSLETMRKDIKAPALERCRMIDAEAKRITEELLALETPIDDQIKKEEARKEAERQKKIEAERLRVAGIRASIASISEKPLLSIGLASVDIESLVESVESIEIDAQFGEFHGEAMIARNEAVAKLRQMGAEKRAAEEQAVILKAEQDERDRMAKIESERLAAERAEQERVAQVERDRLAAEKAEQYRIIEQERAKLAAERAEFDRQKAQAEAEAQEKIRANQCAAAEEIEHQNAAAKVAAEKSAETSGPDMVEIAKIAEIVSTAPDQIETALIIRSAYQPEFIRKMVADSLAKYGIVVDSVELDEVAV